MTRDAPRALDPNRPGVARRPAAEVDHLLKKLAGGMAPIGADAGFGGRKGFGGLR